MSKDIEIIVGRGRRAAAFFKVGESANYNNETKDSITLITPRGKATFNGRVIETHDILLVDNQDIKGGLLAYVVTSANRYEPQHENELDNDEIVVLGTFLKEVNNIND